VAVAAAAADPAAAAGIDSGRFAEPYWYVESPLTTPDPRRPFPGRPPRGAAPATVPGVLVPDLPVRVPGRPDAYRLRQLVREGIVVLAGAGVDRVAVAAAVRSTTPAPAFVLAVADVDVDGALERVLAVGPGESWLLRPDGHLAAVAVDAKQVADGLRRLLAHD
jgi:3-(3-hydroxy-phenyl)propionate hydroxylase